MLIFGFKVLHHYPGWFIIICLALGVLYSGFLYYRNRTDGFSPVVKWILAIVRFISVAVLSWLLLVPMIEHLTRHIDEPILLFVQDNTQSVVLSSDDSMNGGDFLAGKDDFMRSMEAYFDVRAYSFGEYFRESDTVNFEDRFTDISSVFSGIDAQYTNRNIGAVVLASDGIFNRGVNPVYASGNLPYPVYTLALGDTLPRRDLIIGRVRHNRITYLDNVFPVEVHIEARQVEGMSSRLDVSKDGQLLFTKSLLFASDHHFETIMVELEADDVGLQKYRVELTAVEEEISLENNVQEFYIDVIDDRQKVLILADAPHPDVGALKLALESHNNYEVTTSLAEEFNGQAEAYNLIILHQLPSAIHPITNLLETAYNDGIPLLMVIGAKTDLTALGNVRTGISITPRSEDLVEALPAFNSSFALFSLSDHLIRLFDGFPPLFSPFARYEASAGSQVMLFQRIGQVTSEQPLITFSQVGNRKTAVITGEGIWRWRMQAYQREGTHTYFDDLVSRVVQFLSLEEDKSLFRVRSDQFFYEHETVSFEAELYNRSYELVNDPEVSLSIVNEDGVSFPYAMTRNSNAYQLDAGSFSPGEYSFQASTSFGGEQFNSEGRFTVLPLNLESLKTVADHRLLFQVSENTNAMMVYPNQWDLLQEHILNRDDVKPVMYSRRSYEEVINIKAFFWLILFLLSLEWFVRKRSGSY